MIAYVDSSLLARAYLPDETGHEDARRLLARRDVARVTSTLTRIEVSGALVRAERAGRFASARRALGMLDADLDDSGSAGRGRRAAGARSRRSRCSSREHTASARSTRWHLAVASIAIPKLADKGEPIGFASRDGDQATVAESLGFAAV